MRNKELLDLKIFRKLSGYFGLPEIKFLISFYYVGGRSGLCETVIFFMATSDPMPYSSLLHWSWFLLSF